MRNNRRLLPCGLLAGAILAATAACANDDGTIEELPPPMAAYAGMWEAMMSTVWVNDCPLRDEVIGGVGWTLIVDPVDETSAKAVVCDEVGANMACGYEGPVVLGRGQAVYLNVHDFGPLYGLDCIYKQRTWATLSLGAVDREELVLDMASAIYAVEGSECRQLQQRLQLESGKALPLAGCKMEQTVGLVAR